MDRPLLLSTAALTLAAFVAGARPKSADPIPTPATSGPAAPSRPAQPPPPPEAASVDAIVQALYDSVTHPPNREPDWSRLRTIFLPAGRLIPPQRPTGEFAVLGPEDFIARVSAGIAARRDEGGKDRGFAEREISRKTDCFGNICQIFSTYEGRYAPGDAAPFVRGINAIQLVRDGNRWWVVNVLWDQESPEKPIPPGYLPKRPAS